MWLSRVVPFFIVQVLTWVLGGFGLYAEDATERFSLRLFLPFLLNPNSFGEHMINHFSYTLGIVLCGLQVPEPEAANPGKVKGYPQRRFCWLMWLLTWAMPRGQESQSQTFRSRNKFQVALFSLRRR